MLHALRAYAYYFIDILLTRISGWCWYHVQSGSITQPPHQLSIVLIDHLRCKLTFRARTNHSCVSTCNRRHRHTHRRNPNGIERTSNSASRVYQKTFRSSQTCAQGVRLTVASTCLSLAPQSTGVAIDALGISKAVWIRQCV